MRPSQRIGLRRLGCLSVIVATSFHLDFDVASAGCQNLMARSCLGCAASTANVNPNSSPSFHALEGNSSSVKTVKLIVAQPTRCRRGKN
jgi:hypothetical protein